MACFYEALLQNGILSKKHLHAKGEHAWLKTLAFDDQQAGFAWKGIGASATLFSGQITAELTAVAYD